LYVFEKKFGLRVIIAAHPGISYDSNVFNEREIYMGKTGALVKYSKVVISQSSLSVSFAVLYKKPIIFMCTSEYITKRRTNYNHMRFISNILGLSIINIDTEKDVNKLQAPAVNQALYDDYKYAFLTSKDSEGKRTGDIVVSALKGL
jgi:hypothetical protein